MWTHNTLCLIIPASTLHVPSQFPGHTRIVHEAWLLSKTCLAHEWLSKHAFSQEDVVQKNYCSKLTLPVTEWEK